MPIIDPGVTTFDDLGRPTLSPQATRLPINPDFSSMLPVSQQNSNPVASIAPSSQVPTAQTQAQPQPQNAPIAHTPPNTQLSDRYKTVESQAPNREALQPHGLHKVLDILAGVSTLNPAAGINVYNKLQNAPYERAESDWQGRLAAIKPELQVEESQNRERGENERSSASLASSDTARKATESHQKAMEEQTKVQREETERRDRETEAARQLQIKEQSRRDDLTQQIQQQELKRQQERDKATEGHQSNQENIEKQRLNLEAQRLNKESGDKGTWTVETDDAGKKYLFNNKTRDIQDAPSRGINKPSDVAKADEKIKPLKAALDYANTYAKSGKYSGPGDEALLEKFFELAKPSSGFRMTQPQMQMLQKARSWKDSAEAFARHALTGRWFNDDQTNKIVATMNALGAANKIGPDSTPKVNAPGSVTINHRRDE